MLEGSGTAAAGPASAIESMPPNEASPPVPPAAAPPALAGELVATVPPVSPASTAVSVASVAGDEAPEQRAQRHLAARGHRHDARAGHGIRRREVQRPARDRRPARVGVRAGQNQRARGRLRHAAAAADRAGERLGVGVGKRQSGVVRDIAGNGAVLLAPSPSCTTPPLIVVPPVYVLLPERTKEPPPLKLSAAAPLTGPEIVKVLPVVPLMTRLLFRTTGTAIVLLAVVLLSVTGATPLSSVSVLVLSLRARM